MEKRLFKQAALEKLLLTPSRESLLTCINWLDLACAEAPPESLPPQFLARAIIAAGGALLEHRSYPTVAVTIETAKAYVLEPTEEHYARYFMAATNSYPFGSGDGCYAVVELGYGKCDAGSGCVSGAGSLWSFASELGAAVVMERVAQELIPWLRKESTGEL
jgi:hypothetical protein